MENNPNTPFWVQAVRIILTAALSVLSTLFATSCCGVPNPFTN